MSKLTSAERAKILTLNEFYITQREIVEITKINQYKVNKFLREFNPYEPPDKSHKKQLEDYKQWDRIARDRWRAQA